MAITTIRSTYALDVETVRRLEELARRWGVSKSEALRRSVRAAARQPSEGGVSAAEALTELQRSLALGRHTARSWARRTRAERRASSSRREGHSI